MTSSFFVSKRNPKGYVQPRILQVDYEAKVLKNVKKGKVQKSFPFSDIVEVKSHDAENSFGLFICFKANRTYEIFVPTLKERDEIVNKLKEIIDFSNRHHSLNTPSEQVIKSGFAEKKGKIKWSPRRLILFKDELQCFRQSDKDLRVYPLNLIKLSNSQISKFDKSSIWLITNQRKFKFRFETEGERDEWYTTLLIFQQKKEPTEFDQENENQEPNDVETDDDLPGVDIELVVYKSDSPPPLHEEDENDAPEKRRSVSVQNFVHSTFDGFTTSSHLLTPENLTTPLYSSNIDSSSMAFLSAPAISKSQIQQKVPRPYSQSLVTPSTGSTRSNQSTKKGASIRMESPSFQQSSSPPSGFGPAAVKSKSQNDLNLAEVIDPLNQTKDLLKDLKFQDIHHVLNPQFAS